MRVLSLGYQTDLFFAAFDGEIVDRGHHQVIRTPSNPSFHWGNFLLFDRPPAQGDLERWTDKFSEEIGQPDQVGHVALGWDDPAGTRGAIEPFLQSGFKVDDGLVMTASQVVAPRKFNAQAEIGPLQDDSDWEAAFELKVACRTDEFEESGHRIFLARQLERYRSMQTAGHGHWLGAFLDGRLVAQLGLFRRGRIARFQTVETHPAFRRQGLCSTLVYQVAEDALKSMEVEQLVMIADEGYHAKDIYASLGFQVSERQIGISWWQGKAERPTWGDVELRTSTVALETNSSEERRGVARDGDL